MLIKMLDNSNEKPFKCDKCHYTSNRSFDLRRHQQRHTKVKPIEGTAFKCNQCEFITKWKRNMRRHMQKHEKHPVAEDCLSTEEQAIEEYLVEVIEGSEAEFDESIAQDDQTTPTIILSSEILSNETVNKSPSFFKCDLCRYTTKRAYDLRRHEQTHLRVKVVDGVAYKCSECHFVTKWKRNMGRHMRKHEEPFKELEELSKETDERSEEIVVELVNDGVQKSEPDEDSTFHFTLEYRDSPSEAQECSTNTEETPKPDHRYRCSQCNYESKRLFDVRRHAQVHTRIKNTQGIAYKCNSCSFITKWKRNMRRHMEKHKPKSAERDEPNQPFDEFDVDLKFDVESLSEKYKIFESDEETEVLPSQWIALPAEESEKRNAVL